MTGPTNLSTERIACRSPAGGNGYTLVELLVVISIVAILLTVGIPNFSSFLATSRLTAAANSLLTDIQLARSEAARTNSTVTLCPTGNGTTCSGDWSLGRIIFVDANTDGVIDTGGTVIRFSPAEPNVGSVTTAGFPASSSFLSFTSTGGLAGGGTRSITICPAAGAIPGRSVGLAATGHPSITTVTCS